MTLQIGDRAPDFVANTTEGPIKFHEWMGSSWCLLFSHPKDFTPVCTTELGYMAKIKHEFDKRDVKIIGLSADSVQDHNQWSNDIKETQGLAPNYPIIGDSDFNVSKRYGMLPANTSGDPAKRTPADNQTVRNVFVIGPDKLIKLMMVYPMTAGRNFDEVLRVIDALQLTARHKVATPANWKQGEDVIIEGSVSDDEARKIFPQGWKAPRPYLRIVMLNGAKQGLRQEKGPIGPMVTIRQLLDRKGGRVCFIHPDATVFDAIAKMADNDIGSLIVMDREALVGIITERHYARNVILKGRTSPATLVREIMERQVITVRPEQTAEECMALMTDQRVRHLPVIEGGKIIGIVSIGDLVKSIIDEQKFVIDQLNHYIRG
jgi:alkyl hydroperoxide reductase subunit AhpC/CBS domain-containing protein